MIPTLSIRQTMNNLSGIRKAMKTLTRQDVLIGVPADEETPFSEEDPEITPAPEAPATKKKGKA